VSSLTPSTRVDNPQFFITQSIPKYVKNNNKTKIKQTAYSIGMDNFSVNNLKNKYLREKMGFYATFRQQHLRFFNQMAFYSQFSYFVQHQQLSDPAENRTSDNQQFMVSESAYQPIKAYLDFGQLDSMYQL
jgi:hypothetical protein